MRLKGMDYTVYTEFDEETNLYCVFGDNSAFVYATFSSEQEAEQFANIMNKYKCAW